MNSTPAQEELSRFGITPDAYNDTLLSASRKGETATVALLIAAGADVNTVDKNGKTPLCLAASCGHTECARLLLTTSGIDINKKDKWSNTALCLAVNGGHTECARVLLAAPGIDINKGAPLCLAAHEGHTECLLLLLATPGIDVNKTDQYGKTPLFWAELMQHTECAERIHAAGGKE